MNSAGNQVNENKTKRPLGEDEGSDNDHAQNSPYQTAEDEIGMSLAVLARDVEGMDIPIGRKEALMRRLGSISDVVSRNAEELNGVNKRLDHTILNSTRNLLNSHDSSTKMSNSGAANLFSKVVQRGLKGTSLKDKQELLQLMTNLGKSQKVGSSNVGGGSGSLDKYRKKYANHERNWKPLGKRKFISVKASDRFNVKKKKMELEKAYEEYQKNTAVVDAVNRIVSFGTDETRRGY